MSVPSSNLNARRFNARVVPTTVRAMFEGSRRLVYYLFGSLVAQIIIMAVSVGTSIPKVLRSPKFAPVIPPEMVVYR